ncbi:class II fumarate hydratase [Altererythrobacter sp.]|nr:class II fumarate hydratase [Altererythrobacter sp.]
MVETRRESDSIGPVEIPKDRLWGAQTQRSKENFVIGEEHVPMPVIRAIATIKIAASRVNNRLGLLDSDIAQVIEQAAEEIRRAEHDDEFPLVVWQTGSGTQTNMNVNEVIANRAAQILDKPVGRKSPVHPNDHVNLSQSSNDTFPTAIHIAAITAIEDDLIPGLRAMHAGLVRLSAKWSALVKIGRTHTQDAVPLTLGQEFSGYARQVEAGIERIEATLPGLREIAQGGTAVGTGLNAPADFGPAMAAEISTITGKSFVSAPNKFEALAANDALTFTHGALATLAGALYKIANDIRLLSSGPRSGLGELAIPANEPGSSIMPGKVNPTQCEALTQVCAKIMGNEATILFANSQGQFELNTYRPVLAHCFLQSIRLIGDAASSFAGNLLEGIEAREETIADLVDRSLMLVTALAPEIGYDKAADIAKKAEKEGTKLREAALALGHVSEEEFDRIVDPKTMVDPRRN